jgi:hypothetical protein
MIGDLFTYFWLSLVTIIGAVSIGWGVNDLRAGSARMSWGGRVQRSEEPFEFWVAVGGKFLGAVIAGFMFVFGLEMLNW